MLKHISLIFLLTFLSSAHAQEFKMRATIDTVPATGFYKILVSPELTGYANADFSDIRIADSGGGFVPYIINTTSIPLREKDSAQHKEMKIFSAVNEKNSSTIILESPEVKMTTGISLTINNTSVERYAKLSGSANNADWYIISDYVLISRAYDNANESYTQNIYFPSNSYKYFKLNINNQHTDPLNIVGAKTINNSVYVMKEPETQPIPTPAFTQKDSSDHISYIKIKTDAKYLVNGLSLSVTGANLYERNATIDLMLNNNDTLTIAYSGINFTLSSTKPAVVRLPALKTNYVLLRIENNDNPPLKITAVSLFQEKQYLISWLQQGNRYSLLAGNEQAVKPQYDLGKFMDSIPAQLPAISYGRFMTVQRMGAKTTEKENHGYWLWIVISVGVVVLGYVTVRLLKDIKKEGVSA